MVIVVFHWKFEQNRILIGTKGEIIDSALKYFLKKPSL